MITAKPAKPVEPVCPTSIGVNQFLSGRVIDSGSGEHTASEVLRAFQESGCNDDVAALCSARSKKDLEIQENISTMRHPNGQHRAQEWCGHAHREALGQGITLPGMPPPYS
ncbi:Chromosome partition protein MukB [Frankliniella fusca]|uniref:Chromosome partition protein MukB n=1 Tax=Frankliniella fusca TaxID=407009 RepID=A0AAE1HRU7_9NEOP|nr:Chromosome partition protein MukB [Frankliniella fusca]